MTAEEHISSHSENVKPSLFDAEFFPTPHHVAYKMLDKISTGARYFLEPSAGKGDLAQAIKNRFHRAKVDCIEQSPELVAILTDKQFPVVGFDWLDYAGVSYYDACIMNPPFSNGDDHLLRAWDFMHEGEIVCLLNAETIRNPHTAARKRLAAIIEQNGNVEFLGDCFSRAERKTGVDVAMVYLKKAAEDDTLDLWSSEKQEREVSDEIEGGNMLAIADQLGNMEHYYNEANQHMLKAFEHLRKAAVYMNHNGAGLDLKDVLPLALQNRNHARAEFLQLHRQAAWKAVFEKMDFRKWLDKKQTDQFVRDIERNGNIPFTKENIKGTLQNVFQQRSRLFEQSVANVFDELTRYFKGNAAHTEGWKTNDSYKVNEKLVFPYGCEFDAKYLKSFSLRWGPNLDIYNDLDRVLCVLDGTNFETCTTIGEALDTRFRALGHGVGSGFWNEVESDHFKIRFFKKGTVHLTFKDRRLWQEFNLTAAKGRAWLGRDTQTTAA